MDIAAAIVVFVTAYAALFTIDLLLEGRRKRARSKAHQAWLLEPYTRKD